MKEATVLTWHDKLTEQGTLWRYPEKGFHAVLTLVNKHSDFYFNSDFLISNLPLLTEACSALFETIVQTIKHKPDWVITYPPYGLNIGFCLAALFKTKFGYIKSLQEPQLQFAVEAGDKVLLCADDLISGSSIRKVVDAIHTRQAQAIGPIAVIANLSGETKFLGMEIVSLITDKMNTWDAGKCPLCALGSAPLLARNNWQKFIETVK